MSSSDGSIEGRALVRARGFGRGLGRGRPASTDSSSDLSSYGASPFGNKGAMASITQNIGGLSIDDQQQTSLQKVDSGIASKPPTTASASTSLDCSQPAILPCKMPPTRAKPFRQIDAVANMHEMVVPSEVSVYRYDVEITTVTSRGVKDMSKGSPNDYMREQRREDCYKIWKYIVERERGFFGDPFRLYYDRASTFYSLSQLKTSEKDGQAFTITKPQIMESPLIKDVLPSRGECVIVRVKRAEQRALLLNDFADSIDPDINQRDRTLQQFFELATSQHIYSQEAYFNFGNKAYLKNEGGSDLGGGKWLASGFEKNVRFVGDTESSASAVLQLDTKKTAFFKEILITEFASEHLKVRLSELQQRGMRKDEIKSVGHQLRDLAVYTHVNVDFEVDGLTDKSAEEITIEIEGESVPINLSEYFKRKYDRELQFPKLPCVVQRKQTPSGWVKSFHPMELVKIRPGQRVDIKKQTPDQVERMIKDCAVLPKKRQEENEKHRQAAGLGAARPNAFLANLQLQLLEKEMSAKAAVLHAPTVVYKSDKQSVDSMKGAWSMNGSRKFFRPAKVDVYVVMLFAENVRQEADQFVKRWVDKCRQRGMEIGLPNSYEVAPMNADHVKQKMEWFVENKVAFVLFISPDKKETMHDYMKFMEQQVGITTQDICVKTVRKALGDRGADMVLDNISMKTNMKLGGLCHSLEASLDFLKVNNLSIDVLSKQWLRPTRMFVGLDVCHPPPQTRDERRRGEPPKEPSVVGMCVSAGETALDLTGCFWYQYPKREAIINDLDVYLADALQQMKEQRGALPEEIIVYRDGVSEGQYGMVITQEQNKLRKAFRNAGGDSYKPHLTVVVVQKRGNYRIMPPNPTGAKPFEQNVPPGTTIDHTIVHPAHAEWIMVPHRTIQGTAKPIRCTVVVDDEPRLKMEDLEGTMYALCYGHEIVNSPTSLPAPLYGAHELAKRGRNDYRVLKNIEESASSGVSSSGLSLAQSTSQALDDFDKASEMLDVRKQRLLKKTKFWA